MSDPTPRTSPEIFYIPIEDGTVPMVDLDDYRNLEIQLAAKSAEVGRLIKLVDDQSKVIIQRHDQLIAERERAALAEAERDSLRADAERIDWLERVMFQGHWGGTIGVPKAWSMAGPYRHELAKMNGHTLREAIDAARKVTP